MTYQELQDACRVFGLGERATLAQIKKRHRELVKASHPDGGGHADDAVIREINAAYARLRSYCEDYRFSFSRDAFLDQNPEERLRSQFATDPVWGGKE